MAYITDNQTAAKNSPTIVATQDCLGQVSGKIMANLQLLHEMETRIYGPVPVEVEKESPDVQAGHKHMLAAQINKILALLDKQESVINHLREFV